jgi:hypothetical protein
MAEQPNYLATVAQGMLQDDKWRGRLERRFLRLYNDHNGELNIRYANWYFGYLVDAYIKVTYHPVTLAFNKDVVTDALFLQLKQNI